MDTVKGTKDGFNGIKKGSEVVVSSTGKGAEETAKTFEYGGTALEDSGKDIAKGTKKAPG